MNTYVIAEAGVNHNGDLEIAKKLIEEAKNVGASAVKFQSFTANGLLSEDVVLSHVKGGSLKKFFDSVTLSKEDHIVLKEHCDKVGIDFLSTPFSFEAVDLLDSLGVKAFKVASCDLNNYPFIGYIAAKKKKMYISTGASRIDEVEHCYSVATDESASKDDIYMLHCVSNYPTELKDINLSRMLLIMKTITPMCGLSDHTIGTIASMAAVAVGAKIIERHFTLDKTMPGPDHVLSSDPSEFRTLISSINDIETCFSYSRDLHAVSDCEELIQPLIRRSIVASHDLSAGIKINFSHIDFKRPGTGIEPLMAYKIVGKTLNKSLKKDQQIKMSDVE